jgi:ROS/MUCR transcriptional regulator protein
MPNIDTVVPATSRKVLIRGFVFDYAEKAPFVTSGHSILGAVEYDPEIEKVKCHECGVWLTYIAGTHLRNTHQMSAREYKLHHGFNLYRSPLCAPALSRQRSIQHAPTAEATARLVEAGREYKRVHGNNLVHRNKPMVERANASARCQAQTLFRLQVLAAQLGRTPTDDETRAAKLDQPLLVRHFGGREQAMTVAGLTPRPANHGNTQFPRESTCPLPPGFPSVEALLKKKEPWFATARCSEKACVFPAGPTGRCPHHEKMFAPCALPMESSLRAAC